jgi:DNA primase
MNNELGIVAQLVEQDYGISGSGRWLRSDIHSSLVVDNENDVFYFNAREIVGDGMVYLLKVRGYSFQDAKEYLKHFSKYKGTYVYTIQSKKEDIVVYPELVNIFHNLSHEVDGARDYFYKRGINDSTIDRFSCGWYNGFVTIPIFVDGTFRQFQMRKAPTEKDKRSIKKYYRGLGTLPYNFDALKLFDEIFITEGLTDCLRLNQEGIPAVSQDSGSGNWDINWFKYFIRTKTIFVVYDNDEAGRHGVKKVCKNLGVYRCKVFNFDGWDQGYDIVDYFHDGNTKESFKELIYGEAKYLFQL